jgi:hypothetical protein
VLLVGVRDVGEWHSIACFFVWIERKKSACFSPLCAFAPRKSEKKHQRFEVRYVAFSDNKAAPFIFKIIIIGIVIALVAR